MKKQTPYSSSEYSKPNSTDQIDLLRDEDVEDENLEEEEEYQNNSKINGSSSSNNSYTMEENSKKSESGSVRQYIRSKTPRLRWTPQLHLCFIHAVERLGGQDRATPKLVLQMMNVKGLNIAHVKSHLQMYRSKKIDDPNEVISEQRFLDHSTDQNIFNLSKLPILRGYDRFSSTSTTTLRYGNALWSNGHGNFHNLYTRGAQSSSELNRHGFHTLSAEKNLGSNTNLFSSHFNLSKDTKKKQELFLPNQSLWQNPPFLGTKKSSNLIIPHHDENEGEEQKVSNNSLLQNFLSTKRKLSCHEEKEDMNLDLNLSLQICEKKLKGNHVIEDEDNLSLTLFSSSRRKVEEEGDMNITMKNASSSTILDLTL